MLAATQEINQLLNIPIWLARLETHIFEGLSIEDSKEWTSVFYGAINEGSDLDSIKNEFLAQVIESTFESYDNARYKKVKAAQVMVVEGLRDNDQAKVSNGRAIASAFSYVFVSDAADAAAFPDPSDSSEAAIFARSADAAAFAAKPARERDYKNLSEILICLIKGCKAKE